MARIVAQATSGVEPRRVMMAPVEAVRKLLQKAGWSGSEVDLVEVNEAFSVAALAVTRELGLESGKSKCERWRCSTRSRNRSVWLKTIDDDVVRNEAT
jgi:acetyl-CoA acetyltransferase